MNYLADDSIQAKIKREVEVHNKMRDQRQDIDKKISTHLDSMWSMIIKYLQDIKILTICKHELEEDDLERLGIYSDDLRYIRMGLTQRKGRCKICKDFLRDTSGMGLFSERELNLISAFAQTLVPSQSCLFD